MAVIGKLLVADYFRDFAPDNNKEAPDAGAQRALSFADLHTDFVSANRLSSDKIDASSGPLANAKLLPNLDLINAINGSRSQQQDRIPASVLEPVSIGIPGGDSFKSGLFSNPEPASAKGDDVFQQRLANFVGRPLYSRIGWSTAPSEQSAKKPQPNDSDFNAFNNFRADPSLSAVLKQLEQPEPNWEAKVTPSDSPFDPPTANVELSHRRLQTTFGLDTQANGQMPSFYANQKLGKHLTIANGLDGLKDTMTLTADTRLGSMDLYTSFDKEYGARLSAPISSRIRLGLNVGRAEGDINYGLNVEIRNQSSHESSESDHAH